MKSEKCKNCGHALRELVNEKYTHRQTHAWTRTCSVMISKSKVCGCKNPEPLNKRSKRKNGK